MAAHLAATLLVLKVCTTISTPTFPVVSLSVITLSQIGVVSHPTLGTISCELNRMVSVSSKGIFQWENWSQNRQDAVEY